MGSSWENNNSPQSDVKSPVRPNHLDNRSISRNCFECASDIFVLKIIYLRRITNDIGLKGQMSVKLKSWH